MLLQFLGPKAFPNSTAEEVHVKLERSVTAERRKMLEDRVVNRSCHLSFIG
jgi:hypothetical protein